MKVDTDPLLNGDTHAFLRKKNPLLLRLRKKPHDQERARFQLRIREGVEHVADVAEGRTEGSEGGRKRGTETGARL